VGLEIGGNGRQERLTEMSIYFGWKIDMAREIGPIIIGDDLFG
jgi:hypothetical protein